MTRLHKKWKKWKIFREKEPSLLRNTERQSLSEILKILWTIFQHLPFALFCPESPKQTLPSRTLRFGKTHMKSDHERLSLQNRIPKTKQEIQESMIHLESFTLSHPYFTRLVTEIWSDFRRIMIRKPKISKGWKKIQIGENQITRTQNIHIRENFETTSSENSGILKNEKLI